MKRVSKVKARRASKPKRPGRGTLVLIASLLLSSAFVRVGTDAGQAFAKQSDTKPPMNEKPGAQSKKTCAPPPDISEMLTAFQDREERLNQREAQMKARMQALSVADKKVSEKLTALAEAEAELRKTLALADEAAEKDLVKLTAVYENMKPKDAAALFEEMDPNFSAGFLGRMRPESAASIMAGLTPKAAYTISAILAGRNAEVPKE